MILGLNKVSDHRIWNIREGNNFINDLIKILSIIKLIALFSLIYTLGFKVKIIKILIKFKKYQWNLKISKIRQFILNKM